MINDFTYGYVYGFVSAGILGFFLGQIREARNKVRQINRPLDTFADASQPKMTAGGIVISGIRSVLTCLFWVLLLIATIVIMISMFPFR
jgi:hypothetical protein